MPRRVLSCLVVLASLTAGLAGCATPPAGVASEPVALPRLGDLVAYRVEGHYLGFHRWMNGFPLHQPATLEVRVGEGGPMLDGFRVTHQTVRVEETLDGQHLRTQFVDVNHRAIVQSHVPLAGAVSVAAFDERDYPWLFGASVVSGETLSVGRAFPFTLRDAGGKNAPLDLAWRVAARDQDTFTLALEGANGTLDARLVMEPASPYPLSATLTWNPPGISPYVRTDLNASLQMRAVREAFHPGLQPIPVGDRRAPFLQEQVGAEFQPFGAQAPPDGEPYVPFVLGEAVAFAGVADLALGAWLRERPEAFVSRATYHARAAQAPGATTHAWLVQYVSHANEYFETVVERTFLDATGLPVATQVAQSGPVSAPAAESHGWFPRDALPDQVLTVGSGVALMQSVFDAKRVEIFIRSFANPPGYGYFVDGGFDTSQGRYTVIVNAQTGFIQSATGPVSPVIGRA